MKINVPVLKIYYQDVCECSVSFQKFWKCESRFSRWRNDSEICNRRKRTINRVYTVSSQNTAVLRWVKVGKTFGDQVEILSGLKCK